MAAFELVSDKQFIMASDTKDDHDIWAFEYPGDPTRWDIIRPGHNWGVGVRVGNSEHAQFKSLKVLGVAIKGTQLTELARDLILDSKVDNQNFRLLVNRLGHCLLRKVNNPTIVMLRINDYFGWSKYGVTLPGIVLTKLTNRQTVSGKTPVCCQTDPTNWLGWILITLNRFSKQSEPGQPSNSEPLTNTTASISGPDLETLSVRITVYNKNLICSFIHTTATFGYNLSVPPTGRFLVTFLTTLCTHIFTSKFSTYFLSGNVLNTLFLGHLVHA
ncbi:hypothetical protein LINGRAPRIM_LOCUS1307 [Linum grandiflorum]